MNDRQLRNIIDGLGKKTDGVQRADGYDITVATETMAIFCMAQSIEDLKARLARIIVGYNRAGAPVTAQQLGAVGAMAALLKDAINPNLVQTLEGTPAFVHGGPFANIAHGCSSVTATKMALKCSDYTVTEAGFGADLGAEKFLDIKCRAAGLVPDAVVLVATIRALKMHGGAKKDELSHEDLAALSAGIPNLLHHAATIKDTFGLNCVVALNRFESDTEAELALVEEACRAQGIRVCLCEVWDKGGAGGMELAREVVRLCGEKDSFRFAYEDNVSIEEKLAAVVKKVYGGRGVCLTDAAREQQRQLTALGFGELPVCIAKTQYSLSDDKTKLGAPRDFDITVRELRVSAGAGFIVALTGDILTMPGLPKNPAALNIDVDANGKITGLF